MEFSIHKGGRERGGNFLFYFLFPLGSGQRALNVKFHNFVDIFPQVSVDCTWGELRLKALIDPIYNLISSQGNCQSPGDGSTLRANTSMAPTDISHVSHIFICNLTLKNNFKKLLVNILRGHKVSSVT